MSETISKAGSGGHISKLNPIDDPQQKRQRFRFGRKKPPAPQVQQPDKQKPKVSPFAEANTRSRKAFGMFGKRQAKLSTGAEQVAQQPQTKKAAPSQTQASAPARPTSAASSQQEIRGAARADAAALETLNAITGEMKSALADLKETGGHELSQNFKKRMAIARSFVDRMGASLDNFEKKLGYDVENGEHSKAPGITAKREAYADFEAIYDQLKTLVDERQFIADEAEIAALEEEFLIDGSEPHSDVSDFSSDVSEPRSDVSDFSSDVSEPRSDASAARSYEIPDDVDMEEIEKELSILEAEDQKSGKGLL